jgi:hypothetical protein
MTHGAPEYITKIAWGRLNANEQVRANKIADQIIETFEEAWKNEKLYNAKCF